MESQSSYYTKGIRRKMFAYLFNKGFVGTKRQADLIKEKMGKVEFPLKQKFNAHYAALDYLPIDYGQRLTFDNGVAVAEKGGSVNPLTPAVYALHMYNQNEMDQFKLHVDYVVDQAQKQGDYYFWQYKEDMVRFIIPAPWTSGISQGLIASMLLRMYHIDPDEKYLAMAKGAIGYCLDHNNGLRTDLMYGFWIEEYPSPKGAGVLNGFIFFLLALGEIASFGFYKEEFDEGMKGLLSHIASYHKGIYLRYAMNIPDLCNPWYDKIHYHQLLAMYDLTKENVFLNLRDYWVNTSSTNFKTS